MKGSVWRRCNVCRSKVTGRVCDCGSNRSSWAFRVDLNSLGDAHKRNQKFRSGFESRKEAEQALRELLHSADVDRFVDSHDATVHDYVEARWLPAVAPPNLRQSTWTSYAGELRRHVLPAVGSMPLQSLRATHLNQLYSKLLSSGRKDGSGGLSARTVRYIHTILRKSLSDAERWGLLQRNPADLADPPRRDTERQRRIMQTWSAEQLARFLDHARVDRLYAAWHLAATTGMRRGEVLGLRWSDVDFDSSALAIRQAYVSVNGTPQFSEPKTAKSRRGVELDWQTLQVLREWQEAQNRDRRQWGAAWEEYGLVFSRENGTPVLPDSFTKNFRQLASAAKVPPIRLHDLRHTSATLWLQAGVNPKIVSERLGHHSTAFTLDVYSHVVPGMQKRAAEDVAKAIRIHREPLAADGETQTADRPNPEQGA